MNDDRHGKGVMKWSDGSSYDGEWTHGIQNGYGKMTFANGKIKEGIFVDNVFNGEAEEEDAKNAY